MNLLSSTAIKGKTLLDIRSSKVVQEYSLLQVFGCPANFSVKNDKLNSQAKFFVFLRVQRNLKGSKLWNSENKKIMLSRYVIFDETLLLKSTVSQRVEMIKIKDVSQLVEIDATLPSLVGSVSVEISLDVTPSAGCVTVLNAE